jgi:hypothetical protein
MPDFTKIVQERIAALQLDGVTESNLIEELAQDLEDRYRELRSGGATEAEAYQQAISGLDDMHPMQAELKRAPGYDPVPAGDIARGNVFADLSRDLRYAARTMRKNPFFVLFVVLTLALGIGANTTVFTVINTFILNPLPVLHPSELASVATAEAKTLSKSGVTLPISYANLKDYQAQNQVFSALAGYTSPHILTLQEGSASQRIFTEIVTGNYFSTLGIRPAKGRFFLPEEDGIPGAHAVAVMNYSTWQTRFGGADDIVGKALRLNHVVFTIIGVAPSKSLE